MKSVFIFFMLLASGAAFAMPQDSIGVKTMDGQRYIMHQVTKGEGVYGISKKYGVTPADIYAANEGSDKTIKVGQVLLIPKGNAGTKTAKTNPSSSSETTKTEKVYHVVSTGQTLSSIARLHETTVAKIKELNNLKSDNISLGQKLIVGETSTAVPSGTGDKPANNTAAKKVQETPVAEKAEAPVSNNVVVNADKIRENTTDNTRVSNTYTTDDGDEITENGMAVISSEGELSQDRSFILHPTAKVGTIVMIVNPVNNNAVFARVIGNCKVESGCVLKMSKTVAMKLGVSESTSVKVSYAK